MNRISIGKIRAALGKSNGALLIVYALFVIFPHFAAVTHSHPGGNLPHTHSFFSLENENLRRKVLENLGDVRGLNTASIPSEAQEGISPRLIPLERGTRGLQPQNLWHTHFQEDPNLLAVGAAIAIIAVMQLLRTRPLRSVLALPELMAVRPVARGPPGLFFSR